MNLEKMTDEEFQFWAPRSKTNYAQDKKRANNLTDTEAQDIAERDFARLLPDGLNSADNFLMTMKSEEASTVGYLWWSIKGPENNRKAFICDIIVEPKFRGRGFGRKAMKLVEQEAQRLGLHEIGLHVFGFNKPAIQLYESLGYKTTDLVMAKGL